MAREILAKITVEDADNVSVSAIFRCHKCRQLVHEDDIIPLTIDGQNALGHWRTKGLVQREKCGPLGYIPVASQPIPDKNSQPLYAITQIQVKAPE